MSEAVGILVHGDNHFIVRGPLPDRAAALALVRHWSVIRIGATTPPELAAWRISTREFRENLQWAVVVRGDSDISPAVSTLLSELRARGIVIQDWPKVSA
jgi:hypothetical protein